MISELVHGCQKGFIVVPEAKLGSGWGGFGFHLRKAISPETLVIEQPQYVLKPTVEKSKSLLLVMAEEIQTKRTCTIIAMILAI